MTINVLTFTGVSERGSNPSLMTRVSDPIGTGYRVVFHEERLGERELAAAVAASLTDKILTVNLKTREFMSYASLDEYGSDVQLIDISRVVSTLVAAGVTCFYETDPGDDDRANPIADVVVLQALSGEIAAIKAALDNSFFEVEILGLCGLRVRPSVATTKTKEELLESLRLYIAGLTTMRRASIVMQPL